jgi:hypothetical protein
MPSSTNANGIPNPMAALSPAESPCFLLLSREALLRGPAAVTEDVEDGDVLALVRNVLVPVRDVTLEGPPLVDGAAATDVDDAVVVVAVAVVVLVVDVSAAALDEPPTRVTVVEYLCTPP